MAEKGRRREEQGGNERNSDFGLVKNSTAFALRCTDVSNGLKGTLCFLSVFFSSFFFPFTSRRNDRAGNLILFVSRVFARG